jgi:flavin reductase (DIM6/NTAB) family NADH-FMN oxidoreductase RutF
MMTVSWGGLGVLWRKPVTTVYVRHTRLTHDYMDKNDFYVLTFLKDGHRSALNLLGSKSGRDIDKMRASGLTPCFVEGQPTFEEAELALVCRKLYKGELTEKEMLDPQIMPDCYPDKNMHSFYVGEIVAAYAGA